MLTVILLATALADPGDTCGQATTLATDTTVSGNTVNRLPDGTPGCGTASIGGGLWYTLTAPSDGVLTLDAWASAVVPRIAVSPAAAPASPAWTASTTPAEV